ncbi:MAG: FG-GAP-like repeat-containing protein [Acidobacteriaceae bacterium]
MTHVVRTRTLTVCLAVLPAGMVFCLLLLSPLAALSQSPSFSAHSSFTSAVNNPLVLHGDLNNDGYEDLIINTSGSTSRVFLSKGNGAYTEVSASIKAAPWLLGDFNGDGKLDLIAGNHVYLGHGDGTFRSAGVISFPPGSTLGVAAADVNHDGKTDLLILTAAPSQADGPPPGSIQVLFGNGDGTFRTGPDTLIDNGEDGCCVAVQFLIGDFNGDGNVDAVFASGWGGPFGYYGTRVRLFSGDGDGNFTLTSNDQDSDILNLLAADVNGDGISDLVGTVVVFSDDEDMIAPWLDVFYGQSNGGMASSRITLEQYGVGQVAVADFNGDGVPDIAVFETDCDAFSDCTLTSAATMHVISGPGNGGPGFDVTASKLESNPGWPLALRANRDTKADLVYSNVSPANTTTFFTLLNTTTGNFPTCDAPNTAVGITQCSPAADSTVSSPVNFAVGAAADEPIRKIDVWVDRKKQFEQFAGSFFSNYAFLNASLPLAAGSHRVNVIAYGWDNSQQSKVSTLNVTASASCSAPSSASVHICSPASGSTIASPVQVEATAKVSGTIVSTQLWVDGVKTFNAPGSTTLTTSVSLAAGTHRFAVIATNTAGQKWESTVDATVQ